MTTPEACRLGPQPDAECAIQVGHYADMVKWEELETRKLIERLHVIDGYVRALDLWDDISELVFGCEDRSAARQALGQPPFSFSEIQAEHVLDAPVATRTTLRRRQIADEREWILRIIEARREASPQ